MKLWDFFFFLFSGKITLNTLFVLGWAVFKLSFNHLKKTCAPFMVHFSEVFGLVGTESESWVPQRLHEDAWRSTRAQWASFASPYLLPLNKHGTHHLLLMFSVCVASVVHPSGRGIIHLCPSYRYLLVFQFFLTQFKGNKGCENHRTHWGKCCLVLLALNDFDLIWQVTSPSQNTHNTHTHTHTWLQSTWCVWFGNLGGNWNITQNTKITQKSVTQIWTLSISSKAAWLSPWRHFARLLKGSLSLCF